MRMSPGRNAPRGLGAARRVAKIFGEGGKILR
jgi:hypothetical protein